eukprot:UN08807
MSDLFVIRPLDDEEYEEFIQLIQVKFEGEISKIENEPNITQEQLWSILKHLSEFYKKWEAVNTGKPNET